MNKNTTLKDLIPIICVIALVIVAGIIITKVIVNSTDNATKAMMTVAMFPLITMLIAKGANMKSLADMCLVTGLQFRGLKLFLPVVSDIEQASIYSRFRTDISEGKMPGIVGLLPIIGGVVSLLFSLNLVRLVAKYGIFYSTNEVTYGFLFAVLAYTVYVSLRNLSTSLILASTGDMTYVNGTKYNVYLSVFLLLLWVLFLVFTAILRIRISFLNVPIVSIVIFAVPSLIQPILIKMKSKQVKEDIRLTELG